MTASVNLFLEDRQFLTAFVNKTSTSENPHVFYKTVGWIASINDWAVSCEVIYVVVNAYAMQMPCLLSSYPTKYEAAHRYAK